MTNNAVLLDKGIKCLTEGFGLLEAERFIYVLKSQPFDYTEWRKANLFADMSLDEISARADDAYCKDNP